MTLAGCFNGTKTSYMSKDQGKFDFSCHDPFKENVLFTTPIVYDCKKYILYML